MEYKQFIISFGILMVIVCGVLIALIRWFIFQSTESSVRRLDDEIEKAREKQIELSRKLKQADEELEKRRVEARELVETMRTKTEEETKEEREAIINKAREEGEEIIANAQTAQEKMRLELEKEMDLRAVSFSMDILNNILSEKSKGDLNNTLLNEFIENLRNVDMSNINPDVKAAELVTLTSVDDSIKSTFSQIIKEKLNREIELTTSVDDKIGGGAIIKFGSLSLDGSAKNLIREQGIFLKSEIEAKKI